MIKYILPLVFLLSFHSSYAEEILIIEEDNITPSIISKDIPPPAFHDSLPKDDIAEEPINVPEIFKTNESLHYTNAATLQGLNKITAHSSSLEVTMGKSIAFGTLDITVHKCWKAPQEEKPENKALIEIWEQKPGEEKQRVFFGWMFSSSPGVSALEHPVYDVVILECKSTASMTDSVNE